MSDKALLVRVPAPLYRELKVAAAERATTMKTVVTDALRAELAKRKENQ